MPGNMKLNPKEVYELFIEQNIADSNTLIKVKELTGQYLIHSKLIFWYFCFYIL